MAYFQGPSVSFRECNFSHSLSTDRSDTPICEEIHISESLYGIIERNVLIKKNTMFVRIGLPSSVCILFCSSSHVVFLPNLDIKYQDG